jgi:UDP-glucose 4-epimerase
MKILVTGGAGFVGSHLVDGLVEAGHDVVVVDHYQREKIRYSNEQAVVYKMDFNDARMVEMLENEKPEVICHLAAQISVTKSIKNPVFDADRNIIDAVQLLERARLAGVKKIIFASSGGAIYGDYGVRPTPLVYDSCPATPYGVSKQALENYLAAYYKTHGLPYIALRFANIYGPRQQASKLGEEGNVISIFLNRLLTGQPVTIFGDGSASRDYLFVKDAVQAFICALESDYVGAVNVSTTEETTVQELFGKIVVIHGANHPVGYEPFRAGETMRSVLDNASAKELLGWRPMVGLDAGLKQTYDWFMATFK